MLKTGAMTNKKINFWSLCQTSVFSILFFLALISTAQTTFADSPSPITTEQLFLLIASGPESEPRDVNLFTISSENGRILTHHEFRSFAYLGELSGLGMSEELAPARRIPIQILTERRGGHLVFENKTLYYLPRSSDPLSQIPDSENRARIGSQSYRVSAPQVSVEGTIAHPNYDVVAIQLEPKARLYLDPQAGQGSFTQSQTYTLDITEVPPELSPPKPVSKNFKESVGDLLSEVRENLETDRWVQESLNEVSPNEENRIDRYMEDFERRIYERAADIEERWMKISMDHNEDRKVIVRNLMSTEDKMRFSEKHAEDFIEMKVGHFFEILQQMQSANSSDTQRMQKLANEALDVMIDIYAAAGKTKGAIARHHYFEALATGAIGVASGLTWFSLTLLQADAAFSAVTIAVMVASVARMFFVMYEMRARYNNKGLIIPGISQLDRWLSARQLRGNYLSFLNEQKARSAGDKKAWAKRMNSTTYLENPLAVPFSYLRNNGKQNAANMLSAIEEESGLLPNQWLRSPCELLFAL